MSAPELSTLPVLGVGIGYRPPFKSELFLNRDAVDFLEVTADHYLDAPPPKLAELDLLTAHFTVIPHGLNLSIGSAEGLDEGYVQKMAALVKRINPPWWSEHLGYTRAGGREVGQFVPLPRTRAAVAVVARNVEQLRRRIDVPFILENITEVVEMPGAEMSEAEFLAEVLANTGCGLLLDVMNLHANATNHHFSAHEFLARVPLERVVQLHFVGGVWENGRLLDTHSTSTSPEVWDLLDQVIARAPVKGAILERDQNIPPFRELARELARARQIGREHGRWA